MAVIEIQVWGESDEPITGRQVRPAEPDVVVEVPQRREPALEPAAEPALQLIEVGFRRRQERKPVAWPAAIWHC